MLFSRILRSNLITDSGRQEKHKQFIHTRKTVATNARMKKMRCGFSNSYIRWTRTINSAIERIWQEPSTIRNYLLHTEELTANDFICAFGNKSTLPWSKSFIWLLFPLVEFTCNSIQIIPFLNILPASFTFETFAELPDKRWIRS